MVDSSKASLPRSNHHHRSHQFVILVPQMNSSIEPTAVNPSGNSKLTRTFARVLGLQKEIKSRDKVKDDRKRARHRIAMEALLAKVFASISSIKTAYAELQVAEYPYDAVGIQDADQLLVSELRSLSELKRRLLKKEFDSSPETSLLLAEIQEQKSLLRSYDVMGKKLDRELKLKKSEITFLKEKLVEHNRHNRVLEKRLNKSGSLSAIGNLHLSGLSPTHFTAVLWHAVRSIRSYVKLMMREMEFAAWDLDAAASVIEPGLVYWDASNRRFAFEASVSREMFDGFHSPDFSIPSESLPETKNRRSFFFNRFLELENIKPMKFLSRKPESAFAKFCRIKYLQLVHPKMESSFFGSLHVRNLVNTGEFPETNFFVSFVEMAKRVWLLHCLAFSFEPEASIFQVRKNCRYSEVYMESVTDEASLSSEQVAFMVVPGFRIGKALVQCQVYLS